MIKLKKYLAYTFVVAGCIYLTNGQVASADSQTDSLKQEMKSNILQTIIPSDNVVSSENLGNGITIKYMDDDTIRIFATQDRNRDITIKLNKNQSNSYMHLFAKYNSDYLISRPNFKGEEEKIVIDLPGRGEFVLSKIPIKGEKGLFERYLDDGRTQLVDGEIVRGWYQNFIYWTYSNDEGIIQTGWHTINGKTYYFSEDGRMQTYWLKLNGKTYYMSTEADGSMRTGWYKIDGIWYYFYNDGSMAVDTWIDGYYVDASGAWIK